MANRFSSRRVGMVLATAFSLLLPPAYAEDVITTSPSPLTGLWWNANEPGWGASITQHGAMIFMAWYTYDAAENPVWYVIPSCPIVGNACGGDMYSVSGGAPLTSAWGAPSPPAKVGSGALSFTDNDTGTFSYTLSGISGTRAITRQPLATGSVPPATNYSDLWWNPDESGWGVAITQEHGVIFATFYSYGASGTPTWFVAPNCPVAGNQCTSLLYEVHGGTPPALPWAGQNRVVSPIGTLELTFTDAESATMRYTIGGITSQRDIVRQAFGGRGGPAVAYSDLWEMWRAETSGSFCVANGHRVTDGAYVSTASIYNSTEPLPPRALFESAIVSMGGRIDSSTATDFCFTVAGASACVMQFGNALVSDASAFGSRAITISLIGPLPGHYTEVYLDTEGEPGAMISSVNRAPCSTAGSVGATAINGNWYGYGFAYSQASRSGTSTLATMSCANLTCSLLGETSATFALSHSGNTYWRTSAGAPRLAGAEISFDRQLLSVYVCTTPLDEARALESCRFYTFRRDG